MSIDSLFRIPTTTSYVDFGPNELAYAARLNGAVALDKVTEVAPICRTLLVLNLAVRLKHKGLCNGKKCDSREASCAACVQ
jgi:hypothetical protein